MEEIENLNNHLQNNLEIRNAYILAQLDARNHGRLIQELFIELNPNWAMEIRMMIGPRPEERIDLYNEENEVLKIIEVSSLRGDQIAKNFVSRLSYCLSRIEQNPILRIQFAILCYDSMNTENPVAAQTYLRSCLNIIQNNFPEITFFGYYIQQENFVAID